jgi:uncharacterized RDD family membrane protein YckC
MRFKSQKPEVEVAAPFRVRFLSHIIDLFLLQAVQLFGAYCGGMMATTVLSFRQAPELVVSEGAATGMIFGWLFWGLVGAALNYGVLQVLSGGTLGKAVCGLRVVYLNGTRRVLWKVSAETVQQLTARTVHLLPAPDSNNDRNAA